MDTSAFCIYVCKRAVRIVVIKGPSRLLTVGESFHSRAVRQKNIRPAIVVIIEDNCTVAGAFDNELFMFVATVRIQRGQPNLLCDISEVDYTRFDCRSVFFRCVRRLDENNGCESKCRRWNAGKKKQPRTPHK